MYRSNLNSRDKGGAVAAVIAIHAALLFALLHISGKINFASSQSVMRVFDLNDIPPPPPPPPPLQSQRARPKEMEGGSAPKNIKSEATPVETAAAPAQDGGTRVARRLSADARPEARRGTPVAAPC